ncbi:hypothetical protein C1H46_026351 [Malus baccata]|uniref:Autophagy-related protein n=1 Tax=Malus baccata TaxID=106549 RepID=A0A540LNJ0_MALBA|nr:hypothetical protein C1H46_026351 [Malus baccata]
MGLRRNPPSLICRRVERFRVFKKGEATQNETKRKQKVERVSGGGGKGEKCGDHGILNQIYGIVKEVSSYSKNEDVCEIGGIGTLPVPVENVALAKHPQVSTLSAFRSVGVGDGLFAAVYVDKALKVLLVLTLEISFLALSFTQYHVPGNMTLGEFILFIRVSIKISKKRPIFVSFKNTKPHVGALFYEIDEQNEGKDGFLHITYGGEDNVCGSNEEQEHGDKISFENENSQGACLSAVVCNQ